MVYRLLTRKTYEMHMFHKASLKLGLDRAVLAHARNMDAESNTPAQRGNGKPDLQAKEIDELLKRGAYDVFREDDQEQREFVEADIDSIMKRSAHKVTYGDQENAGLSTLSSFSKASFVSTDHNEDIDINDPDFWKKAVGLSEPKLDSEDQPGHTLPQQRRRKQNSMYDMEAQNIDVGYLEDADWDDNDVDDDQRSVDTATKPSRDKKGDKDKTGRASKEPKDWGPHSRDRLVRALLLFGFGRWKRIQKEAGAATRSVKDVEKFARAYIMQCGLCASDEQSRHDSAFVQEAIRAARSLKSLTESGQKSFLMPSILLDERFVTKLKSGGARKSLTKLDMLSQLTQIISNAVEECKKVNPTVVEAPISAIATPTEDAPEQADESDEPKRRKSKKRKISTTGDNPPPAEPLEIDDQVQQLGLSMLAEHLRLNVSRPGWTRVIPWWDEECDKSLVVGVFQHGYGKYSELRTDPNLVFHKKIVHFVASKSHTQTSLGDNMFRVSMTLSSGQDVRVQLPSRRQSLYRGVFPQPGICNLVQF
jgi:chromodomain-helicase-DNA-binding protein 7